MLITGNIGPSALQALSAARPKVMTDDFGNMRDCTEKSAFSLVMERLAKVLSITALYEITRARNLPLGENHGSQKSHGL